SPSSSQRIRLALMATAAGAASPDNFTGNGLMRAIEAHRVLLWNIPIARLAADARAVKGVVAWRDGRTVVLPWSKGLDLSRAKAWDFSGRRIPLQGAMTDDGKTLLRSPEKPGAGVYILKIPLDQE